MKQWQKRIGMLSVMIFLSGCASFSPVQNPPMSQYILSSLPPKSVTFSAAPVSLLVALPMAAPGYRTAEMLYVDQPFHLQAFSQHRWVAPPASMLAPLIEQTLRQTGYFKAIITPPFIGTTDYTIITNLLELDQKFQGTQSAVVLRMSVTLMNNRRNEVIMTDDIQRVVPVLGNGIPASVQAANLAVESMLADLRTKVLSALHVPVEPIMLQPKSHQKIGKFSSKR